MFSHFLSSQLSSGGSTRGSVASPKVILEERVHLQMNGTKRLQLADTQNVASPEGPASPVASDVDLAPTVPVDSFSHREQILEICPLGFDGGFFLDDSGSVCRGPVCFDPAGHTGESSWTKDAIAAAISFPLQRKGAAKSRRAREEATGSSSTFVLEAE